MKNTWVAKILLGAGGGKGRALCKDRGKNHEQVTISSLCMRLLALTTIYPTPSCLARFILLFGIRGSGWGLG
jgi:hypothetical protein